MWSVIVENIGTVFHGSNGFRARVEYAQSRAAWPDLACALIQGDYIAIEHDPNKNLWFIEVTDVYCGEANYSWVTRHVVRATTQRGAVWKLSRDSGLSWRHDYADRYNSKSGATCCFVNHYDEDSHGQLRIDRDCRKSAK